jgi:hypothetical protein
MYMTAPADQLRLHAALTIDLNGPDFGLGPIVFPSTLLQGDPVNLASDKGHIILNNTAIISLQTGGMDFVAPRGTIQIHNSFIAVTDEGGVTPGFCRYQVDKKVGQVIGLPHTPTADPTNIFFCIPQVIKK